MRWWQKVPVVLSAALQILHEFGAVNEWWMCVIGTHSLPSSINACVLGIHYYMYSNSWQLASEHEYLSYRGLPDRCSSQRVSDLVSTGHRCCSNPDEWRRLGEMQCRATSCAGALDGATPHRGRGISSACARMLQSRPGVGRGKAPNRCGGGEPFDSRCYYGAAWTSSPSRRHTST